MSHSNTAETSPLVDNKNNVDAAETKAVVHRSLSDQIEQACARIAPSWPLDRFIAVNPFWGMIEKPIAEVSAGLRAASGASLLMPRAWYRSERAAWRLTDDDLQDALARSGSDLALHEVLEHLEEEETPALRRASVVDVVDSERDLVHEVSWRDFVTNGISQFCASFFDEAQASLQPARDGGLYASWVRHAQSDAGPALLMGAQAYRTVAATLPDSAAKMIEFALRDLEVPESQQLSYLHSALLDINGWASWCAYRRWTARLAEGDDAAIVELLAVRLAWDWLLLRMGGEHTASLWRGAMGNWPEVDRRARDAQEIDWVLQKAREIRAQRPFIAGLAKGLSASAPKAEDIAVQAAFCIDVRSEVFRRALEAESDSVQTLGFAGFFGLPVEYQPLGAPTARPQLPGLLAAGLRVTDTGLADRAGIDRARRLARRRGWQGLKASPLSTFTFVESMGLTYLGKLLADGFGLSSRGAIDDAGLTSEQAMARRPRLTESCDGQPVSVEQRAELAAGILSAMSLTRDFAPLVLLAGHGSETENNPHAAGLDCGACCGQTGEVNARATAALLNDRAVRAQLRKWKIEIPATTHFVAGLHNTTTDDVTLFDLDEVPAARRAELDDLREQLRGAGSRARVERARLLGVATADEDALHVAVRERASDWSQVRPEWGLAGNGAFVVAPRERSAALDLGGRSFLHDYRYESDAGFGVLELIMTAPMVVTHWINMQYYASTVDNRRYGSGNKVLHNVVGGHVGVFEGNGGDLRIGLPMQSLHSGEDWVHTPLRLSVYIEAPRQAIADVLERHAHVRDLVDNGWIDLFQIDRDSESVRQLDALGLVADAHR